MKKHTVLLTGATSGIGLELTNQLIEAGHKVIAIGRNKKQLEKLEKKSDRIVPIEFDVAELPTIGRFIEATFAEHPDIDILINNAGIQEDVRVDDPTYMLGRVSNEIKINLTAPIEICRAALPLMIARPENRIVNVTSGLAYVPKRTSATYSATKAGLHLFTEALRVQMGESLKISEVILPLVDTPMTEDRGGKKLPVKKAARQIISGINRDLDHIYVGRAKFLPMLLRWAPWLARRIVQKP